MNTMEVIVSFLLFNYISYLHCRGKYIQQIKFLHPSIQPFIFLWAIFYKINIWSFIQKYPVNPEVPVGNNQNYGIFYTGWMVLWTLKKNGANCFFGHKIRDGLFYIIYFYIFFLIVFFYAKERNCEKYAGKMLEMP